MGHIHGQNASQFVEYMSIQNDYTTATNGSFPVLLLLYHSYKYLYVQSKSMIIISELFRFWNC